MMNKLSTRGFTEIDVVRSLKLSQASSEGERTTEASVLVVILTPDLEALGGLADDLQHRLTNMCSTRSKVEVVIVVGDESQEARLYNRGKIMHTILHPSRRDVLEAYRILTGHYS